MASVPPPTTSAQPPPPRESSQPATPLSWEGEKMFNIYIYDYCFKRGFRKTARELLHEAEIPPEATPPINARQGLLFEWWSVFWVLFQAKSNGGGSEDALLYTQHQQQQQVRGRPIQAAPVAGQPSQPPIQRQNPLPPGVMNGMATGITGQHQVPPGPTPMNFAMGGAPAPQPNGIAAPHPPTPGSAPNQPQQLPHGPQPPNFNHMLQQGPRPASMNGPQPLQHPNGQQQPQRPIGTPNNNLPFQSPTMAHSPNVQQGPSNQQAMGAPPMGNMTGPSPLLRGGMIPNGVQQGMVIGGVPQQPNQGGPPGGPQGPGFNQMAGRPPSRTTTPQMPPGMMMQSSPSMANRQLAMAAQGNMAEFAISNDLSRLPPQQLQQAKSEVGIPQDKDIATLTFGEKKKLLEFCQRRIPKPSTPGGPSPMMQPPPNLQQRPPQHLQQQQHQQARAGKRNSTSPGEEPDNMPSGSSPPDRKRPRRSPENAPMVPKGGATPMPYPQTPQQMPAVPPPGPQQGMAQGPPGHPQQQPAPNMMMRPQPGPMPQQMMNGQPIPPPGMMMQGQPGPQGPPGMGGMQGGQMNPQGQMGPPAGGMANQNQIGSAYHRVPLHQAHTAGLMQGQPNAGSPAGPDPSFGGPNPGGPPGPGGPQPFNQNPANRMLDQKPPQGRVVPPPAGAMMPPRSPANNAKDAQKDGKDGSPRTLGQPPNSQQQHGQPGQSIPPPAGPAGNQQVPPPGTPAPPPGPPQQPAQQQQQGGGQPTPGGGGPSGMPGMTTGNPLMGGPMGLMGSDSMLFNASVDFGMSEFEFVDSSSMGNIDFERDFGQWFNGPADDISGALEMK